MRHASVVLSCLLAASACQPLASPAPVAGMAKAGQATLHVAVHFGSGFAAQAAPKTPVDVAKLTLELLDADDTVLRTEDVTGTSHTFADLADGSYKVRATAYDAAAVPISTAPVMAGPVVISGGNVTYPGGGASLPLTVTLLDGTGEKILNQVTLTYESNPVTPATYRYQLVRTDVSPNVVTPFESADAKTHFTGVPDGEYLLKAEAFDGSGQSITLGGVQTSSNTVKVTAPSVDYGGESAFAVSLSLFIDKWTSAANMLVGRLDLAAVTATDGKIYAFGGPNPSGNAEVYDPDLDEWSAIAAMPTPRTELAAVAHPNGNVYVIGGINGTSGTLRTLEAYNPSSKAWTALANMSTRRAGLQAAVGADQRIYVVGGWNSTANLSTVEVYDPDDNTWSTMADLPAPRVAPSVVAAKDGTIYVIGGHDGSTPADTVYTYDQISGTWVTKAAMPMARYGHAAAMADNGKIYVFGGQIVSGRLTRVDAYDPATDAWAAKSPLPEPRAYAASTTAANRKIYVIGGQTTSTTAVRTVSVYEP